MSKTHWKQMTNPNYIGAYALQPGQDIIVTIKNVQNEMVMNTDGKKEECIVAHFIEPDVKPMILNSTNCKTIQKIYKTPFIEEWQGRKIQLYIEKVKAFGELVEALRIRAKIPELKEAISTEPVMCADCGAEIEAYGKMDAVKMAAYTYSKYGKSLCSDCAQTESKKTEIADPLGGKEENENN